MGYSNIDVHEVHIEKKEYLWILNICIPEKVCEYNFFSMIVIRLLSFFVSPLSKSVTPSSTSNTLVYLKSKFHEDLYKLFKKGRFYPLVNLIQFCLYRPLSQEHLREISKIAFIPDASPSYRTFVANQFHPILLRSMEHCTVNPLGFLFCFNSLHILDHRTLWSFSWVLILLTRICFHLSSLVTNLTLLKVTLAYC